MCHEPRMAAARRVRLTVGRGKYHMSIKKKVFAVAATLTMVGGVSAVGLMSASAQTPSCGGDCTAISGMEYGPNFPLDVLRQGEKVGQPIILFRDSNTDPAEDFTVSSQGTVGDFYTLGMESAAMDLNYSTYTAFELEYSPYGVDSGLCLGVGTTAGNGTPVALENCGVSDKTVWVLAQDDPDTYLINGSNNNFSHPYVL